MKLNFLTVVSELIVCTWGIRYCLCKANMSAAGIFQLG